MSGQANTKSEEGRDGLGILGSEQEQSLPRKSWNPLTWIQGTPSPKPYPSISSIPKTSPERLALASPDNPFPDSANTVLYLAYGSNLAAKTFLGTRGIRPLSQINVTAPAFELTFNLAGIPYMEPCFANTRFRKIPKPPLPGLPPYSASHDGPTWTKGLYGVVYEVTREDYATIIKTEGGGRGYQDVLTPCFELPPPLHLPERSPIPDLPKPFLVHTLYAPLLPGDGDGDGDGIRSWLRRLFLPSNRPDPDYAQASLRYLNLLRDGAREHDLPEDYQMYLAQLQPYTITRTRQKIGRALFLVMALPVLLIIVGVSRLLADDTGRTPRWFGLGANALSNILWLVYDMCLKPVFGDGERSEPEDEDLSPTGLWRGAEMIRTPEGLEGEKTRLLGGRQTGDV